MMALPTWGIKTPSLYNLDHLYHPHFITCSLSCWWQTAASALLRCSAMSGCSPNAGTERKWKLETQEKRKENRAPMNLFVGDFRCRCLHGFKLLLFVQLHFWQVEELTLRGDVSGLTVPLLEDLLLASLLMEDTQWVSWNIDEQPTSSYCMTRYSYLGQIQWEILVWCLSRFAALWL